MATSTPIRDSKPIFRPSRTTATSNDLQATILISTFERPEHLKRALLSVRLQKEVDGKFEVVVTDDGSRDHTGELVEEFRKSVDFPVHFTTHSHEGFQLARCRNEGVRATTAPYLLFMDGDLILPPDFVAQHLANQLPNIAMAGESCYLPEETSQSVNEEAIHRAEFMQWIPKSEKKRIAKKRFNAHIYRLLRRRALPRFKGGNIGMWREDYQRVNGYDQNFVGWGAEEDDLQRRLSKHGVRFRSSLIWTTNCHLWHPPSPSFDSNLRGNSVNRTYMNQAGRLSICRNGLVQRKLEDLTVLVTGKTDTPQAKQMLAGRFQTLNQPAEIEIIFAEQGSRFCAQAECNVLVLEDPTLVTQKLLRETHILVSDSEIACPEEIRQFSLREFENALGSIS